MKHVHMVCEQRDLWITMRQSHHSET